MRIVNKEVTGILAIAIMLTIVTPVFAEATVYHDAWTVDYAGWSWWSECANELVVTVKGTGQYRLDIVVDSTGVVHYTFFGRGNLLGVGQVSGEVYQTISVFSEHWHNTEPYSFPSEWTFVNTSPSISHGGLVNGMFTIRNHVTVNANGIVTAFESEVQVTCHG